jgi:hypothetical protein
MLFIGAKMGRRAVRRTFPYVAKTISAVDKAMKHAVPTEARAIDGMSLQLLKLSVLGLRRFGYGIRKQRSFDTMEAALAHMYQLTPSIEHVIVETTVGTSFLVYNGTIESATVIQPDVVRAHTHPSGICVPSFADLMRFMKEVQRNPNFTSLILPSTDHSDMGFCFIASDPQDLKALRAWLVFGSPMSECMAVRIHARRLAGGVRTVTLQRIDHCGSAMSIPITHTVLKKSIDNRDPSGMCWTECLHRIGQDKEFLDLMAWLDAAE